MRTFHVSYDTALAKVQQARPWVRPNDGFVAQLKAFERMHWMVDPCHPSFEQFREHIPCQHRKPSLIVVEIQPALQLAAMPQLSWRRGGGSSSGGGGNGGGDGAPKPPSGATTPRAVATTS